MTYLILAWISASIGFVLGAVWAGLGMKNKQLDERIAGTVDESYSKAQRRSVIIE
ncbi:MAG: hypothetical protein LJE64_05560 [Desulfofustis sp.]|jgi:hypothetical protein|nr:hypothetical protein [Desulfofustis sp.]